MQLLSQAYIGIYSCLVLIIAIYASDSFAQTGSASTDTKIRNIDGVVAVVNTGVVTRKEVDDRIASLQKQGPVGGKKLPEGEELRKQVLENLILEKIQIQEAEQTGLAVANKELNKIIEDIAARNKLSMTEFRDTIIKTGMSFERYSELLREDVLKARLREREVDSQIKISDAEIDNFIVEQMQRRDADTGTARASGPEEIAVAQIFIPVEEGAGPSAQADARKKAESILKEARGDADFMQLGAQANKENSKIKFQDLGYRTQDRLPQIFIESVRNLGPGQVASSVVRSPAGFHVLKVMDRRSAGTGARGASNANSLDATPQNLIVTQTLARHILIRQRQGLQDADVERRLQGYRDQIRAKTADFESMAKKFSEDGSAQNGGVLGNDTATTVMERRDAQLTVEKQREFARAAIRERKFEQAYQDWLRQLRDTATVKILNVDEQFR
jgi:peptidyl-prolyl cis-trans isomerase SurA